VFPAPAGTQAGTLTVTQRRPDQPPLASTQVGAERIGDASAQFGWLPLDSRILNITAGNVGIDDLMLTAGRPSRRLHADGQEHGPDPALGGTGERQARADRQLPTRVRLWRRSHWHDAGG
jgi:hypothetical protein